MAMLCNGDTACICATVISPPQLSFARNKIDLVKFRVADETGTMDITFFNQSWLKNTFKIGSTFVFHGKCEALGNLRSMTSPVWESPDNQEQTGRMVPRYSLTAGLSNLMMMRAAAQILPQCQSAICDIFDPTFRTQYDLCDSAYAHAHIHFPDSPETLDIARRRLAFEELFLFTLGLGRLRGRREQVEVIPCHPIDMDGFYNALPFTLTNAQRRSVEEALDDCCSGRPMNRLCQGDVGSGKTMVAAACVYFMAQNGRQSAMMAPTEILAQQHFNGLSPYSKALASPALCSLAP
ncbi:DEAD/DEAH box helicase [Bengtsoniella intestinalis]